MSENNNNNQEPKQDDFTKQLNDLVSKTVKTVQDYSKKAADKFDLEKQKAQIRSEIGHNIKDISSAYEKLGRGYYDAKVNGKEFPDEAETIDLIKTKEAANTELNQKLEALQ